MILTRMWSVLLVAGALGAQAPPPITLSQAVDAALKNYPAIRVSKEQIAAAAAGIELARTAYLPRVDALAQVDRATRNNVFGLMLPQNVIPSISGPVIGASGASAWGSALGTLVTWEPFDFGLRRENVAVAAAARQQSEAALKRTEFEIAVATADACLTLVAAQDTARAAQAGVDRAGVVLRTINALVNAELRPGADSSRAEAELAAARTQLIRAQQAVDVARATIAQFTGMQPSQIEIASSNLLQLPPEPAITVDVAASVTANPRAAEQRAAVEQAQAQLKALERSYFPRFYVQGSAYARGTGWSNTGVSLGDANGLGPNTGNYALGLTVTFPISDLAAVHAREAQQAAAVRAQIARSEQIAAELRAQWNIAVANHQAALRIAANTPVQVRAARAASEQSTARYQAGLGSIADVADAQRLLTQAEIDDALARLSVWRGLLGIAATAGDIRPFLAESGEAHK